MKNNAGSDPSNNPNHAKRDSVATKVAVVTGASRGIGLALAKRLIANGYRVVANSRNIGSAMTLQNTTDLKLVDGDIALRLSHRSRVGCHVFIGFLKHILTYINPNGDHSCALRRQNKMNSGTYSMARKSNPRVLATTRRAGSGMVPSTITLH